MNVPVRTFNAKLGNHFDERVSNNSNIFAGLGTAHQLNMYLLDLVKERLVSVITTYGST